MPTLKHTIMTELSGRYHALSIGNELVPEPALFRHVAPFIPPVKLSKEDIVEILKRDERLADLNSATDSEVKIFAEILYRIMNGEKQEIYAHSTDLQLLVDLSQSKNLDDILSGKVSLKLFSQGVVLKCGFLVLCMGGLLYGGIRGLQYTTGNYSDLGADAFIIIAAAFALVSAVVSLPIIGYANVRIYSENQRLTQRFTGDELRAFYKKHSPPPQVSVAPPNLSEETPLLPEARNSTPR